MRHRPPSGEHKADATKPRLVVIGPVPPPHHGVTVSTARILENVQLQQGFEVSHVDTSDHRSRANIGKWDAENVVLALRHECRMAKCLWRGSGVVYLPLSQGVAFLRDALFIHLARLLRWKVAIHFHAGEFRDFYNNAPRPYRWWIRLTMSKISSAGVLGYSLQGVFGGLIPADRIVVLPNGVPDASASDEVRHPTTVLFLSHLRRRKGVAESIDTALLVLAARSDALFVFAGDWEDEKLRNEIQERARPAGDAIRLLPLVLGDEKKRLLASASVFLFPPVESEGHPLVILEALAAGLPVVATDRGAIGETVIAGECGFILENPTPEALAEKVLLLLNDDPLRMRMSQAARQRYLDVYTQRRADERLANWLTEVAAGR